MCDIDVALSVQSTLLAASACWGAYVRAPPPLWLGYSSLLMPSVALFLLWRRVWVWPALILLTLALCVLCAWGAASARPIVRTHWRDGRHSNTNNKPEASPDNAIYAAAAVLALSTLLWRGSPGPTLLGAAFAVVALNDADWDWNAAFAFLIASALAVHLSHGEATVRSENTLACVWGTPAAFALMGTLLTRRGALVARPAPRSASVWAMGR